MSRRLAVVADDLGASKAVNRGVLATHRDGIVTAASLLVGMPHTEAGLAEATDCGLPLGLHLRLSVGPPLTDGPARVGLCDKGQFLSPFRLLGRLSSGGDDLEEALSTEIRAQMEAFLAMVPQPDHINAHHHLHLHPAVLAPLIDMARDLDFPALRWPVEPLLGAGSPTRNAEVLALRVLSMRGRRALQDSGFRTSNHFRGLRLMDGRMTSDRLCRTLGALLPGTTELMVHPALGDGASAEGVLETETLRHPDVQQAIHEAGIALLPFRAAVAQTPS